MTWMLFSCTPSNAPLEVEQLTAPVNSTSGEPYLFTDPSGNVFLSWIEGVDSINYLKMSRLENNNWTAPVLIASGNNWFVNWADYPLVVSDGKGRFMAHVLDRSGEGAFSYDVKITTSADGITWTEPVVLHDDGKQAEHGFVSLVPYGENVLVSWLDGRNTVSDAPADHDGHDHHGEMTVRAAVVTYEGEKLMEWELDNRACDCCQTTATVTSNGPVVIYRDRSETEVRDMSVTRLVDNVWTAPKTLHPDNWQINGCPVNGPRCESIGNSLVVAWFTLAGNKPAVKVLFSNDGGATFGKPVTVSGEKAIGRVDVVLLDGKTAIVTWMENDAILATRVHANGRKEEPVQVAASSGTRSSGFPQMTRTTNGVIVAWTSETKTINTANIRL